MKTTNDKETIFGNIRLSTIVAFSNLILMRQTIIPNAAPIDSLKTTIWMVSWISPIFDIAGLTFAVSSYYAAFHTKDCRQKLCKFLEGSTHLGMLTIKHLSYQEVHNKCHNFNLGMPI